MATSQFLHKSFDFKLQKEEGHPKTLSIKTGKEFTEFPIFKAGETYLLLDKPVINKLTIGPGSYIVISIHSSFPCGYS